MRSLPGRYQTTDAVMDTLESMEMPATALFAHKPTELGIFIPGGVGDIIKDPDGGVWIHGLANIAVRCAINELVRCGRSCRPTMVLECPLRPGKP